MRIFLPIENGNIPTQGFTSLKGACKVLGVEYSQAVRGKRNWPLYKEIREIEIVKQVRNAGK